ncbi:MAG: LysE family translocator [Hyphomicrobiaceae bacterium]
MRPSKVPVVEASHILAAVSIRLLLGATSPGPGFVVVAQISISSPRAHGVLAAFGMGLGGVIFAVAALLGLKVGLTAVPALYMTLKLAGGANLGFLAYRLWTGTRLPFTTEERTQDSRFTGSRAFTLGLSTQLGNPKTAIVYAIIFAGTLPETPSLTIAAALILIVFIIELGWYSIVAVAFSTGRARAAYGRGKAWIDRIAAGALAALGLKILKSARIT